MIKDASRYRVGPGASVQDVDLDETEVRLPDGQRLSEDLAEQLATDTIQRGVGRPAAGPGRDISQ